MSWQEQKNHKDVDSCADQLFSQFEYVVKSETSYLGKKKCNPTKKKK